jgi:hypothetical protein
MSRDRKESKWEESQLVGVPHYVQGEADGLCVYYAMSMMLAALHPEWRLDMHDTPRGRASGSPVFHGLRFLYQSQREYDAKVSHWFFNGMTMTEAARLLNEYFRKKAGDQKSYFRRYNVRARRIRRMKYARKRSRLERTWTTNEVITALSWHLPVIVAGGGLGGHAVVAFGYALRGNADREIVYFDPSLLRAEWRPLGDIFIGDAEVIVPSDDLFRQYRPARVSRIGRKRTFEVWTEKIWQESQRSLHG